MSPDWSLPPLAAQVNSLSPASQILYLSAIALGTGLALQARWISDDAFISFRYAENLVAGHGLVFDLGERIEAMTNLF